MKSLYFIEMLGVPGSYDASVYDHFEEKYDEGLWFKHRFKRDAQLRIITRNVCINEPLPDPNEVDGLILGGSHNSVHDATTWQTNVRDWLTQMRAHKIPILAVCGSHQLIAHMDGAEIGKVPEGAYAGTFPVSLTEAGQQSLIMRGLENGSHFQFANREQVNTLPPGSTLLASSSTGSISALDFGDHCYSTQFHPERTHDELSTVWRNDHHDLIERYRPESNGERLVNNFLDLVLTIR